MWRLRSCCVWFSLDSGCRIVAMVYMGIGLLSLCISGAYIEGTTERDIPNVVLMVVALGSSILILILSGFLLYGVSGRKRKTLMLWIVVKILIFLTYYGVSAYVYIEKKNLVPMFITVVLTVPTIGCLLVVISFYLEIWESENRRQDQSEIEENKE